MNHHPMSQEQYEVLNRDLVTIMQNLSDIANLLDACYGNNDPRVTRAEESRAGLQRLLWALERQDQIAAAQASGPERMRQMLEMQSLG